MSLIACNLCGRLVDSDDEPDGFYVKGYADKYVCCSCVEQDNLEYEV